MQAVRDIVRWPRKLEVVSWKEAYRHFSEKGNQDICRYADRLVYGKKFISLVYLAQQTPILYSDTDVLWYSTPSARGIQQGPYVKMGSDVSSGYYSGSLLECLGEHRCTENVPFNAGVMYLNGDLSTYPKWPELCRRLAEDPGGGLLDFTEQTAFAILANHFNAAAYFTQREILIRTDDTYALKYTLKHSPGIIARHYVNTRRVAFWRDFAYICINKKLYA